MRKPKAILGGERVRFHLSKGGGRNCASGEGREKGTKESDFFGRRGNSRGKLDLRPNQERIFDQFGKGARYTTMLCQITVC